LSDFPATSIERLARQVAASIRHAPLGQELDAPLVLSLASESTCKKKKHLGRGCPPSDPGHGNPQGFRHVKASHMSHQFFFAIRPFGWFWCLKTPVMDFIKGTPLSKLEERVKEQHL